MPAAPYRLHRAALHSRRMTTYRHSELTLKTTKSVSSLASTCLRICTVRWAAFAMAQSSTPNRPTYHGPTPIHIHTHTHTHLQPDRLSTRPLLNSDEKRWIIFQLLKAVAGCHTNNVCHGDIKLDNVLLTSWNWVFLTDFASFKPTRIPVDNPAAFSFFFDTSGRQGEYPFWSFFFTTDVHPHHHYICSHESFLSACSFGSAACYIAPERFYIPDNTEGTDAHICRFDGQLLPAMDIFSLGCVIYELVTDGKVRTHACTRHPPTVHTNLSCPLLF
jgi:serine/threonine protein kinase